MSPPTMRSRVGLVAIGTLILACRMAPRANGGDQEEGEPSVSYSLGFDEPSITETIDQDVADPEKVKFLEFKVLEVANPKRHPLIFEVHYQQDDREKRLLGSFSLFPPDNPGEFIVATRGQLRAGGKVTLTLDVPEGVDAGENVRVDFGRIGYRYADNNS